MAKRKVEINLEELKQKRLDSAEKEILEKIEFGITPKNPVRTFIVDERVLWGAHKECYVRKIGIDNLYYLIESCNVVRERNKPAQNELHWIEWFEIFKYDKKTTTTVFREENKYNIRYCNSSIESLIHYIYHAGIDFDVDYQRDYVWDVSDKIALIDSIFKNIDIGKFLLAQRNLSTNGKLYEVIDGKQRLTAIKEFYEDRFQYNGVYFTELNPVDKNAFYNHPVTYGYLENPTREAILDTFIKMNTKGRVMDNKDIDKAKELLTKIKK